MRPEHEPNAPAFYAIAEVKSGIVRVTTRKLGWAARALRHGRCFGTGATRQEAQNAARLKSEQIRGLWSK